MFLGSSSPPGCGSRQAFPEARSLLQLADFLRELSFHTSSPPPVSWENLLSLQAGLSLQNHPRPGWWTQAREGRRGAGPSLGELGKAVCASPSDSHCDGCTFYWMVSADTMCLRLTKAFFCFNRKKTRGGKCHRVFSFIRWRKEITYTKVSLGKCVRQRTCHFVQPA